ncbi:MAG TPA: ParB N-terminal domain-containing protein [Candidatus Paceibacterota bacterium]
MLDKTKSKLRDVLLPGGDVVSISDTPEEWWPIHNRSGFADTVHIAPDPKNPRKRMNPARQKELEESIRARGVRQALIVTPREFAPWASINPEHKDCYFLAVSGHRRRAGAIKERVGAVPIMIKIYPSEKEHRMDVSLLNKGQDDLTPLEEGAEFIELQELGWTIKELCDAFGYAAPQLYDRMHLTKLDPIIQKDLDPELPVKKRLAISLGGALGGIPTPTLEELEQNYENLADSTRRLQPGEIVEFDKLEGLDERGRCFALQRLYYAVIKFRGLTSAQAIEFIRDHKLKLGGAGKSGGKPAQRYEPRRRKDTIDSMVNGVNGSLPVSWKPEEWRRIFELASREEVEEYIGKLQQAQATLAKFVSFLVPVRDAKKAMRPEVAALFAKGQEARKIASGKK